MAATVDQQAIEINLRATEGTLSEVCEFAAAPGDFGGWDTEWGDVMDRLIWLLDLDVEGGLGPEQARRLDAVLTSLAEQLPLVNRLRLSVPPAVRARLRVKQP